MGRYAREKERYPPSIAIGEFCPSPPPLKSYGASKLNYFEIKTEEGRNCMAPEPEGLSFLTP